MLDVPRLKTLWLEGFNMTEIAAALETTRNAVAGKIHRLRKLGELPLSDKVKIVKVNPRVYTQPKRKPQVLKEKPKKVEPPVVKVEEPEETTVPAFGAYDATVALRERSCRWPLGHPRDADFHYCGKRKVTGAYCADHARISYVPLPARREGVRPNYR